MADSGQLCSDIFLLDSDHTARPPAAALVNRTDSITEMLTGQPDSITEMLTGGPDRLPEMLISEPVSIPDMLIREPVSISDMLTNSPLQSSSSPSYTLLTSHQPSSLEDKVCYKLIQNGRQYFLDTYIHT